MFCWQESDIIALWETRLLTLKHSSISGLKCHHFADYIQSNTEKMADLTEPGVSQRSLTPSDITIKYDSIYRI